MDGTVCRGGGGGDYLEDPSLSLPHCVSITSAQSPNQMNINERHLTFVLKMTLLLYYIIIF